MILSPFIKQTGEKPLDNIVTDGGFTNIFRTIGCIGDSLSSGEFETIDEEGKHHYNDLYEYSWGQFIARACGSKVYNFSKGGMTAKEYIHSFAEERDFYNPDFKCQAYIIALGVNDVSRTLDSNWDFGTYEDIENKNLESFMGCYAEIIRKYKEIAPDAKFFLMTHAKCPVEDTPKYKLRRQHRDYLYKLCEIFDNCYVLDIMENGINYCTEFYDYFYLNGHMNPMGYSLTAKIVMSYIDYIIRNNPRDFEEVGLINTGIVNYKEK